MNKTKLALLLLTAHLIGVCVGFFANESIIRARVRRYSQIPANMPEHVAGRLTVRLGLSQTQRDQVLAVLSKHESRMKDAREKSNAMIDALLEEVRLEIAPILTPEQVEAHKKIIADLPRRRAERGALLRAYSPPEPTNPPPAKP